MSTPTSDEQLLASVNAIKAGTLSYDVTIICTTDDHQASYWMNMLETGLLASGENKVLAVSEDWGGSGGGAGNGLGTLYAWTKACTLAQTKYNGMNLQQELLDGNVSAALFHTAGKGTRMAPLPASENNNKPGVRLPFPLKLPDGTVRPLTVLESVVKQTGIYASSRKGRLSVYWGDQVFLPSAPFLYKPTHHIDILCTLIGDTAPTAQEWNEQGLEKYGVIAVMEDNNAAQVEKVSHETAITMLGSLGSLKQVGPSLGSFSVSAAILTALCTEFSTELTEKTAKLDTDPHFWMPLTLPVDSYIALMKQKGTDEEISKKHHERMSIMKSKFDLSDLGLFGAVNVGKDACWWDYGQLKLYSANTLVLREESKSADLLRAFLDVDQKQLDSTIVDGTTIDDKSYIFGSKITKSGSNVSGSLLAGVSVGELSATDSIIVNCACKKMTAGKGSIIYNIIDNSDDGIIVGDDEVLVGVYEPNGEHMKLKSAMSIDGGKAWKNKLDMNTCSFEDIHKKNKDANIGEIAKQRKMKYDTIANAL